MKQRTFFVGLSMAVALAAGCSDADEPGEGGDAKAGADSKAVSWDHGSGLPDGYKLYDCTRVGKSCNAHDPCAINPICGPDKKCRPSTVMNCDDGDPESEW